MKFYSALALMAALWATAVAARSATAPSLTDEVHRLVADARTDFKSIIASALESTGPRDLGLTYYNVRTPGMQCMVFQTLGFRRLECTLTSVTHVATEPKVGALLRAYAAELKQIHTALAEWRFREDRCESPKDFRIRATFTRSGKATVNLLGIAVPYSYGTKLRVSPAGAPISTELKSVPGTAFEVVKTGKILHISGP